MLLVSLFTFETCVVVILTALTFLFFYYFPRLRRQSLANEKLPFISVLVPARNEEAKIGRCLESLANQNYYNYEVIAIDDRSSDGTGEIIKAISKKYSHIKYVTSQEAPAGWIGKCNALVNGIKHASGHWYLFTDADTCHTKESLRYAVSYAIKNNADLISFMPKQELGSFWERVVMPVLLGSFLCGDPLNTLNEHTADRAYAYGQYILIKKEVYDTVGGHASVFDQILDDISLARRVKSNGYQILSADGQLLYRVRMYTNFDTLWQGWTKNLYALIECKLKNLIFVITILNTGILMPFVSSIYVAFLFFSGNLTHTTYLFATLTVIQITCLYTWYIRTTQHYVGVSGKHFLLLPLGSLTVSVLYLYSAYLVLSGNKVQWKGRQYTVNKQKTILPETKQIPLHSTSLNTTLESALVVSISNNDSK